MSFCTNCGEKNLDDARFCTNCGKEIGQKKRVYENRKTAYDGKIHKCPNCGEILGAFDVCCPACGYELRGRMATDSVQIFYQDLKRMRTSEEKAHMIRNFPIPNAKEDIVEFMILASTNIMGEEEKTIYEAWFAKFEQVYQKALISFGKDPDFMKIQQIYDNCQMNIDTEKRRKIGKFTIDTIIRNIAACTGLVLMFIAVVMERSGDNASMMELVSCIMLIASAVSLFKRGASLIDYAVGAASGLLLIILSFMFYNGSVGQLAGGVVLVIVAVNYFKGLNQPEK